MTVAIIELLLTDDSKFSLIHVSDVCAFMQNVLILNKTFTGQKRDLEAVWPGHQFPQFDAYAKPYQSPRGVPFVDNPIGNCSSP